MFRCRAVCRHCPFGYKVDQSLEGVALPSSPQASTLGQGFFQSLEVVALTNSPQTLTFGYEFDQMCTGS